MKTNDSKIKSGGLEKKFDTRRPKTTKLHTSVMTVVEFYSVSNKTNRILKSKWTIRKDFGYLVPKLGSELSIMRQLGFQSQFSRLIIK